VLSGIGLSDELITRSEESYRLWCVVVCDLETSRMRRSWPSLGRSATGKKKTFLIFTSFTDIIQSPLATEVLNSAPLYRPNELNVVLFVLLSVLWLVCFLN